MMPQSFTDWVHALKPEQLVALRAFRSDARQRFQQAENPVTEALAGDVPAIIAAMPRDFVERVGVKK